MSIKITMILKITSATKTIFGQWELSIRINGQAYKYYLSDYGYQKAMQLYNKGLQGRALAVLNKYQEGEG
jgi:hypothetical protein